MIWFFSTVKKLFPQKVSAGIELESRTLLPEGSGLGTSSILAGCLLAALWTTMGRSYSHADLVYGVKKKCAMFSITYSFPAEKP